ncbi:hypothetical protein SPI_01660 [Niveomyces insectorum RCEF 264]|uniref:Uncharacterized protein n=1 Tax=Niveomyces insectorum RCEF 264 TaxID=1081102 RepID=A0A167Z4P0_9HYPO|nr:hypothetical protein SPI_01660 [Niveomyces insectorum RCEF 264]
MLWQTLLTASVLVAQAYASVKGLKAANRLAVRASDELERRIASAAAAAADDENMAAVRSSPRAFVKRQSGGMIRVSNTAGTGVVLNPDGSINMAEWNDAATQACNDALVKLPESSNPSGTCICYNLPALDNTTGTFEADLRLFQLSTPSGEFAGIPPENIQVGLSYAGASVSPVTENTASKLVAGRAAAPSAAASSAATNSNGLRLLQTYLFVGQIKPDVMATGPNMAQLEALVTPTVTLTGTGNDGKTVSTNVSSNEAAFVAGVFSQTEVLSNTTLALQAVNDVVNGLHNGTVAFVLPGVQIIMFPVGLVIISIWLAAGLAVIGFGTIERINYRDQYKRRMASAAKPVSGRI